MATRVGESPWTKDGEEKRKTVRGMFADIAPTYDLLNSLMSFRLHYRWRSIAVRTLELRPGNSALDVCSGTGCFLTPLQKAVGDKGSLVGVDFCAPMLAIAAKRHGSKATLAVGDACQLPVASATFDGATVGWGLRNVPSLESALSEILRVLKPGGRFVSLDMSRPTGLMGTVSERVFHTVVPVLGTLFGKKEAYTYLPKSTLRFLPPDELAATMSRLGFVDVWRRSMFFGNVGMVGGRKP